MGESRLERLGTDEEPLIEVFGNGPEESREICYERGRHRTAVEKTCEPMTCYDCGLEFRKGDGTKYEVDRRV